MLFNSFEFLLFFPIVTLLYFLTPHKMRWFVLLVASCIFYMMFIPVYIMILLFTISIDYFVGILLDRINPKYKRHFLIISILSNIGILFIFKYFNFFNSNLSSVVNFFHWNYPIQSLSIILPIGLSFHTFQSLSYIVEVYRGKQKPEKNFGIFALYVMFYPQLVAGPIERPQNMLHQFHEKHYFDVVRVTHGLKIMLWGLFKKIVIADRLAVYVNQVYAKPDHFSGQQLLLGTVFFAIQIYCDFSGYSDIAIGSAKVMGYDLMTNFKRPYLSKSISEFWSRWHISLSTWFKDYVYIPLGGNRVGQSRWYFNLFITFLLSGFWHGANWTYIIWGALNGFYLVFAVISNDIRINLVKFIKLDNNKHLHSIIKVSTTFALTLVAWIFFRASNVGDAIFIIKRIILSMTRDFHLPTTSLLLKNIQSFGMDLLKLSLLLIIFLFVVETIQDKLVIRNYIDLKFKRIGWIVYYIAIFAIIVLGQFSKAQFIYFQF